MFHEIAKTGQTGSGRYRHVVAVMLWLALSTGLLVSIASLIEELCMADACSDAASFVFFGAGMGVFGCVYFTLILLLLFLRHKNVWCGLALGAMIFSGVGAELRLLWIQKYIIGGWCPLCVTICCSLFFSALLLVIERVQNLRGGENAGKDLAGWLMFMIAMSAVGLMIAIVGVRALY